MSLHCAALGSLLGDVPISQYEVQVSLMSPHSASFFSSAISPHSTAIGSVLPLHEPASAAHALTLASNSTCTVDSADSALDVASVAVDSPASLATTSAPSSSPQPAANNATGRSKRGKVEVM